MSTFEPPDHCAIPNAKAPRRKVQLICKGSEDCFFELSEKSFYSVGGGKEQDISIPSDSASARFNAVIFHDVKGKTYIYDLGSSGSIYLGKKRTIPACMAYDFEVDSRIYFGSPQDPCTFRLKLLDVSAPKTQEQVRPKGQGRTELSNGMAGALKRPLEKDVEPSPCTDAVAKNSFNLPTDVEQSLENIAREYAEEEQSVPSQEPTRRVDSTQAANTDGSEPSLKRPRNDVPERDISTCAQRPAKQVSDTPAVFGPAPPPATEVSKQPSFGPEPPARKSYAESQQQTNVQSSASRPTLPRYDSSKASEKAPGRPHHAWTAENAQNRSTNGSSLPRPVQGPAAPRPVQGPAAPERAGSNRPSYGPAAPERAGQRQSVCTTKPAGKNNGKCDKCDGPHPTASCPNFKKTRENHKDAWANYGKEHPGRMGTDGGKYVLRGASVVRQPGDGSCLFHSLCYGLRAAGVRANAYQLRTELADYIRKNPKVEIAGDTLEEWVSWDSNTSVNSYAQRMAAGRAWGGGIEIAACSLLTKSNVHVYERKGGEIRRISCFDYPRPTDRLVHILYQGGTHYDALVVNGR